MPAFMVKDLMINVVDRRLKTRPGASLCTIDQPTTLVCTIHSPLMSVARLSDRLEHMGRLAQKGTAEVLPELQAVASEVADALVVGAIQGGGRMLPDPNCGGTSLETIPPTLTPVVSKAELIRVTDLPALKERLQVATRATTELAAQFAPKTEVEVQVVAENLKEALGALSHK